MKHSLTWASRVLSWDRHLTLSLLLDPKEIHILRDTAPQEWGELEASDGDSTDPV